MTNDLSRIVLQHGLTAHLTSQMKGNSGIDGCMLGGIDYFVLINPMNFKMFDCAPIVQSISTHLPPWIELSSLATSWFFFHSSLSTYSHHWKRIVCIWRRSSNGKDNPPSSKVRPYHTQIPPWSHSTLLLSLAQAKPHKQSQGDLSHKGKPYTYY